MSDLSTLFSDTGYSGVYPDGSGGYVDASGIPVDVNGNPATSAATQNQTSNDQSAAETARLNAMNAGDRAVGATTQPASTWDSIAKALGIQKADGTYDLKAILALTGAGLGVVGTATTPQQTIRSVADLRSGIPATNTAPMWTADQIAIGTRPMQTGGNLARAYASSAQSPLVAGQTTKGYADGGDVQGPLSQAFAGAVQGDDGGQSDLIDAKLSPGEYVMDAESVSALGDGNTQAGIAKLDQLRQQLREQKRGAPTSDIPPQAQGPLSYMQGGQ